MKEEHMQPPNIALFLHWACEQKKAPPPPPYEQAALFIRLMVTESGERWHLERIQNSDLTRSCWRAMLARKCIHARGRYLLNHCSNHCRLRDFA